MFSRQVWICLTALLCTSGALPAQVISGVTIDADREARHITITGATFSASDQVTVAGIAVEKLSVSDTQIVATLPAGIRLVAGEYVVRVVGQTAATGTLRLGATRS